MIMLRMQKTLSNKEFNRELDFFLPKMGNGKNTIQRIYIYFPTVENLQNYF